jgi:hypothetical protein
MGIRSAQQYVQVLGTQNQGGEIRIQRMYADVLIQIGTSNNYEKTINHVLGITDVTHGWIEDRSFTDNLGFVSDVSEVLFAESHSISHPLTFVDSAIAARDIPLGVSSTLNLVSLGGRVREGEPANTLGISDLVLYFNLVDDRKPVGNVLNFVQTVETLSALAISHDLGITDSVVVQSPFKPNINHYLGLSHHVSTPHRAWISHTLGLSDIGRVPLPTQHISHDLQLVDESPIGKAESVLVFTQSAEYGFSLTATNLLELVDSMDLEGLWVRSVSHDLGIGHALTWYEDTKCGKKQYTPFQGENTISDTTAPSDVLQDAQGSTSDRLSLYQPALGSRLSEVILRAPELDNRDRNSYSRVQGETRGGKIRVFADPIWPKVRTLAVTVIGLTESQVDEMQTFMQDTLGEQIGLTDWEGRLWSGTITNPDEVATQDGRNKWTVTFQFEGEMLDVEQPGNDDGNGMAMDLSDAVSLDSGKWFVDDIALDQLAVGVIV